MLVGQTNGLYTPLSTPRKPWGHISMDFMLGFPKTPRGHDSMLVVVDIFSMSYSIPCVFQGNLEATWII